jgi:hypothetical protein
MPAYFSRTLEENFALLMKLQFAELEFSIEVNETAEGVNGKLELWNGSLLGFKGFKLSRTKT